MTRWSARRLAPAIGVFVAVSLLLLLRANNATERELGLALSAERSEDLDGAIIHYRRAASWLLPLSNTPEQALSALSRLANEAQQQENAGLELLARRGWFAAVQSRRWLWVTRSVEPMVARIAALSVQGAPASFGDGRSPEQRRAALHAELLSQTQPKPLGFLLTVVGFVCWVGAMFLLPRHGFDVDLQPTAAARHLGTWIVLGFGLFALGLALA